MVTTTRQPSLEEGRVNKEEGPWLIISSLPYLHLVAEIIHPSICPSIHPSIHPSVLSVRGWPCVSYNSEKLKGSKCLSFCGYLLLKYFYFTFSNSNIETNNHKK
jgi:hypothetical protein